VKKIQLVSIGELLSADDATTSRKEIGPTVEITEGFPYTERILFNRLLPVAEELLPETNCGFRPSRGTMDMIFSARQIQEKFREQHQPPYMAFFNLAKVFHPVNR